MHHGGCTAESARWLATCPSYMQEQHRAVTMGECIMGERARSWKMRVPWECANRRPPGRHVGQQPG